MLFQMDFIFFIYLFDNCVFDSYLSWQSLLFDVCTAQRGMKNRLFPSWFHFIEEPFKNIFFDRIVQM